jgi:hypothetical protein
MNHYTGPHLHHSRGAKQDISRKPSSVGQSLECVLEINNLFFTTVLLRSSVHKFDFFTLLGGTMKPEQYFNDNSVLGVG